MAANYLRRGHCQARECEISEYRNVLGLNRQQRRILSLSRWQRLPTSSQLHKQVGVPFVSFGKEPERELLIQEVKETHAAAFKVFASPVITERAFVATAKGIEWISEEGFCCVCVSGGRVCFLSLRRQLPSVAPV